MKILLLFICFSFCNITFAQSDLLESSERALVNGNHEKSLELAERYISESGLSRNDSNTAKVYLVLARNYKQLEKPFFAFEHYLLASYAIDFDSLSYSHNSISEEIGDLMNAWSYYRKANVFYQKVISNERGVHRKSFGKLYRKIALNFSSQGLYSSSNEYFKQIIERSGSLKEVNEAKLGVTHNLMALQKYSEALEWILSFYKTIKEVKKQIILYNYLGYLYQQSGDYSIALTFFEHSLKLAKSTGYKKEEASILQRIGFLRNKQVEYTLALKLFLQSLEILKQDKVPEDLQSTYNYISKLYLASDQLKMAIAYADSSLALEENSKPTLILFRTNELLKTIYEQKGAAKKTKFYQSEMNRINLELEQIAERNKTIRKDLLEKIDNFESQYTALIRNSYLQGLEYENLKLSTQAQKNELGLMLKDRAIDRQKLLLSNEQLESEHKARAIERLKADKKIQALLIEKQKLYEQEKKQQILSLEKDVYLNELDLQYKDQKIQNQQYLQHLFTLAFVIFSLLVLIVYFIINSRQKIQKDKIESYRKDTENKLFRSQMNPHFLFNSLNSIKSFILTNEIRDASSYLSKFALLMRHILDNSDVAFIPLWKEIETLSLYLDLEKLRFEDRFKYQIIVDEEIEIENTYVPSMLLQPHVENAILHGVSRKKSEGLITIEIREKKDNLICSVEDNGIGRKKAKELNTRSSNHKSKATHLVRRHLENINSTENTSISMEVFDLTDHENRGIGTRVELCLPYKLENTSNY